MKLFGSAKPKPPKTANVQDAVLKMRENIEMLEKREKFLQTKIDKEIETARANAQKNKKVALMALKRKKTYEHQIDQHMSTRANLEQQLMYIDNASINIEAMRSMQAGNDALKIMHGSLTIEKVDEIMDEVQEQQDLAKQISDVISQPMGEVPDDDELLAELEELEQQEISSKLLEVEPPASSLLNSAPKVPTTDPNKGKKVAAPVDDDEDELEALRQGMALS